MEAAKYLDLERVIASERRLQQEKEFRLQNLEM